MAFAGDTEAEVRDKLDQLERVWQRNGHGYHFLRAETAAEQAALTKVRKAGLGLLMAASEGPHAAGRVRRGHRRARLSTCMSTSRASRRSSPRAGWRPASTATARSAACTSARSSTSRAPTRSR